MFLILNGQSLSLTNYQKIDAIIPQWEYLFSYSLG